MNTFLPYHDFAKSAKVLDNKRLGKQRVECLQILQVLKCEHYQQKDARGDWYPFGRITEEEFLKYKKEAPSKVRKTPWYNHPAVQMWKGYEDCLYNYMREVCLLWIRKGFKDICLYKAQKIVSTEKRILPLKLIIKPPWLGLPQFHLSHQSNLIRKLPSHYRPIFGPDIPDNLPYYWPTKQ